MPRPAPGVPRHTPARIWGGALKGSPVSGVYQRGDWLGVCSYSTVRGQTESAGASAPARLAVPERIARGEVVTGCSGPATRPPGPFRCDRNTVSGAPCPAQVEPAATIGG